PLASLLWSAAHVRQSWPARPGARPGPGAYQPPPTPPARRPPVASPERAARAGRCTAALAFRS
ncbi:MAG: hypothetical protein M3O70_12965, partial [Actinomycetota bacterium]|nr:hypothetical protein [Actinomycetota bacterium]